jgi:hypothetical protein
MTEPSREISFPLQYPMADVEGRRPIIVLLQVGQDYGLEMMPNPFAARSTISRLALADLQRQGLIPAGRPARMVLRDLRLAGQPIADLEVSVGSAATLLRVDGILGFDFFQHFAEIRFDTRTFVMTLVRDV